MRRFLPSLVTALGVVIGLVGLVSAPAVAHEEINPKTAVVGKPTFFQLSAANEKKVGLTKITLHAPANLPFGATTHSPAGWHADVTASTITWSGGTVAPDAFETWGFEIEGADQAATFTYKADLGFADGSSDSVDVPITAVADGATTTTTSGAATTATSAGATATTSATTNPAGATSSKQSDGTARGIGVAALVLSLLALTLVAIRRAKPTTSAPSSAPDGTGNDW